MHYHTQGFWLWRAVRISIAENAMWDPSLYEINLPTDLPTNITTIMMFGLCKLLALVCSAAGIASPAAKHEPGQRSVAVLTFDWLSRGDYCPQGVFVPTVTSPS